MFRYYFISIFFFNYFFLSTLFFAIFDTKKLHSVFCIFRYKKAAFHFCNFRYKKAAFRFLHFSIQKSSIPFLQFSIQKSYIPFFAFFDTKKSCTPAERKSTTLFCIDQIMVSDFIFFRRACRFLAGLPFSETGLSLYLDLFLSRFISFSIISFSIIFIHVGLPFSASSSFFQPSGLQHGVAVAVGAASARAWVSAWVSVAAAGASRVAASAA